MKYLNSKEVSGILGINISTLKRWTDSGKLGCEKTAGGHRKFTMQHIRDYYKMHSNSSKSDFLSLDSKDIKRFMVLLISKILSSLLWIFQMPVLKLMSQP